MLCLGSAMSKSEADPGSATDDDSQRTPREESFEDFNLEWCQKQLNDQTYQQYNYGLRAVGGPKDGSTFTSLMSKTLFTDHTIRAMKLLYKPASQGTSPELLALISLGDGMCSHTNVLHGGINTTIIDEIGGRLAAMENQSESLMAVNFNVNLRKAVRTPGVVLVKAWFERPAEGRKIWAKCVIEQDGVVCIESESLYLKLKGKL